MRQSKLCIKLENIPHAFSSLVLFDICTLHILYSHLLETHLQLTYIIPYISCQNQTQGGCNELIFVFIVQCRRKIVHKILLKPRALLYEHSYVSNVRT